MLEDREYSLEEMIGLAEAGDAEAQNEVGVRLMTGFGTEADPDRAIDWFMRAADQNLPFAIANIGWAYSEGMGVDVDEFEALKWLHRAAELGCAGAMHSIGCLYLREQVGKDMKKAMEWFEKAAAAGYTQAVHKVGELHQGKPGIPGTPRL